MEYSRYTVAIPALSVFGLLAMLVLALPPRFSSVDAPLAIPSVAGDESVSTVGGPTDTAPDQAQRRRLRFQGWELEWFATLWFLAVIVLAWSARHSARSVAERARVYLFGLSVAGLASVFWIAWDGGATRASSVPIHYWLAAVMVVGVFLLASTARPKPTWRPFGRALVNDALSLLRHPLTWLAAVALLSLSVTVPEPPPRVQPALGEAFVHWFAAQPRVAVPDRFTTAPVSVLRFIDYQCPGCKNADDYYAETLARLDRAFPGMIDVVTLDFPLDEECNKFVSIREHAAACAAATALRIARGRPGSAPQQVHALEDWLWANQASLSKDDILGTFQRVFGTPVAEHEYDRALSLVQQDVALGHSIGVSATPTYFINGVRLSFQPAANLEAAILHELDSAPGAAGGTAPQ